MVDENYFIKHCQIYYHFVQIPLWSMKTFRRRGASNKGDVFRFLYGRWKLLGRRKETGMDICSDSSMVDENPPGRLCYTLFSRFRFLYGRWKQALPSFHIAPTQVQIPLWSMKTISSLLYSIMKGGFRFLYGRWKLACAVIYNSLIWFRFLYGRWKRMRKDFPNPRNPCSDSSMVDENRRS